MQCASHVTKCNHSLFQPQNSNPKVSTFQVLCVQSSTFSRWVNGVCAQCSSSETVRFRVDTISFSHMQIWRAMKEDIFDNKWWHVSKPFACAVRDIKTGRENGLPFSPCWLLLLTLCCSSNPLQSKRKVTVNPGEKHAVLCYIDPQLSNKWTFHLLTPTAAREFTSMAFATFTLCFGKFHCFSLFLENSVFNFAHVVYYCVILFFIYAVWK